MADSNVRKAELERKKAKLQAIREEKERRRREKEAKEVVFIVIIYLSTNHTLSCKLLLVKTVNTRYVNSARSSDRTI